MHRRERRAGQHQRPARVKFDQIIRTVSRMPGVAALMVATVEDVVNALVAAAAAGP